jgi:predicted transcriptional regulator
MSGSKHPAPLSEAQIEIMDLVWERGRATVTEVWKSLEARRPVARTTVLTVMDRLVKKGWLQRSTVDQQHVYSAVRSREAALGRMVQRLVDTAFAGSAENLVVALLDGRGISDEEAKRIRKRIQEARRKSS